MANIPYGSKGKCVVCRLRKHHTDSPLCGVCANRFMADGEPRGTNDLIQWVATRVWECARREVTR